MMMLLPFELWDEVFEYVALSTADSRHSILPLASISKAFHRAQRISHSSLCLLSCTIAKAQQVTREEEASGGRRVKRLLLSFKDLDATPGDDTIPALLQAVSAGLNTLVLYICAQQGTSARDLAPSLAGLPGLRELDLGSFGSFNSLQFDDLLCYLGGARQLRKLTYEVAQIGVCAGGRPHVDESAAASSESLLREVSISAPGLSDANLLALVNLFRHSVQKLSIKTTSTALSAPGLVAALSHCPHLTLLHLSLSATPTSSFAPPASATLPLHAILPTLPRLVSLNLTSPGGPEGIQLASLAGLARRDNHLVHLELNTGVRLDAHVALSLARTPRAFPRLERLGIQLEDRPGSTGSAVGQAWANRGVVLI